MHALRQLSQKYGNACSTLLTCLQVLLKTVLPLNGACCVTLIFTCYNLAPVLPGLTSKTNTSPFSSGLKLHNDVYVITAGIHTN